MSEQGGNGKAVVQCVDCPVPNEVELLGERIDAAEPQLSAIGRMETRLDSIAEYLLDMGKTTRAIYDLMDIWSKQSQHGKRD